MKSVRTTLTEWKSLSKWVKIIPKRVKITPKRVRITSKEWLSLLGGAHWGTALLFRAVPQWAPPKSESHSLGVILTLFGVIFTHFGMIFTRLESDLHSVRVVLTLFTLLKSNHFTLFTLREYKFWQKRDWICAFMVPLNTHSFMKRRAAPLQPPEMIYYCKFRPKRAWNYGYLACKIQNFLRPGAPPPCNHIRIHFDRKGTEIVHLWFPPNTHSLMKRRAAPCNHQILYICKLRPKRARNYPYLARKIQNFLRKDGGSTPFQPPKSYEDCPLATTGNHIFLY